MLLQKVIGRTNWVKKSYFYAILKVIDESSRIRLHDPDPDSLVGGMDPRIRIQPKMLWIRNTEKKGYILYYSFSYPVTCFLLKNWA